MKKLFLIDAYAMIYRAFYSFLNNPMINSKGESTSAVYGFMNFLLEIIKKEDFTHIAVVFDPPYPTFRNIIYPEYKAQRPLTPEGIKTGVPHIKDILDAMGIKRVEVPEYEADDVIGTLAKKAKNSGFEVFMVTPDKDYNQLLDDGIFIYRPKKGSEVEIISKESFCKETGLDSPTQFIDILALWGDAADNVKGMPGVGEKTAYKLISEYKSIDGIYQHINSLKGKQKENFSTHREDVDLSKKLVTIVTDAPADFSQEDFKQKEINENELRKIFADLEFKNMADRVLGRKKPLEAEQGTLFFNPESVQELQQKKVYATIQNTPHDYKILESDEELLELKDKLLTLNEFCFDTETTGLETRNNLIVGMSFSFKAHEGYYIPFDVNNQEDTKRRLEIFKPVFENENILKIGQNIKFDILVLRNYDIHLSGKIFDTMVAHYLLEPERKHNMDDMSEFYLNYTPVHIEELIGEKKNNQISMSEVDKEKIKEYAAEDADITFQLKEKLYKELEKNDILSPAMEIEMPLVQVLAEMEFNGVAIDTEFLKEYTKELNEKIAEKEKEIYSFAGKEFNISSPRQLGEILFNDMKITDATKTTKTGQFSTGEEELQKIKDKHPIVQAVLDYRGLKKLVTTYTEALPELINPKTGRIHTSFNQTVTVTGRLSSTNPNLQNIPVRSEEGRKIRTAFIASKPENLIYSADYSQVELRIMAHCSNDENMIKAFENDEDIHKITAANIYGIKTEEVTKQQRSIAKSANFGIIYGISSFGLSQNTGLSRSESKALIDNYFQRFPGIKQFIDSTVENCKKTGYVSTMYGHKRYLPDINSRNFNVSAAAARNAVNTPIQGTAADIIKIAMINILKELKSRNLKSKMMIQVHDELVFEVVPEEKDLIKQIVETQMENAAQLKVKLKVEGNFGKNWAEAH